MAPRVVTASGDDNVFQGQAVGRSFEGERILYFVQVGPQTIGCHASREVALGEGADVELRIPARQARVVPLETAREPEPDRVPATDSAPTPAPGTAEAMSGSGRSRA